MNNEFVVCKHCGYDTNPITATQCLKCGQTLDVPVKNINMDTKSKPKSLGDWLFTPWMIWLGCGLLFLLVSWSIYSLFGTTSSVNNSNGVGVVNSNGNNQNIAPDVKLYDSMKDVPNVPEGTFNYGASSSFAVLTANGLHEVIAKAHPNFRLRFTEPRDGKSGSRKAVAMLIDGQLTFALQGSSLKETDYDKAKERSFTLKQVPVALDALVFFTHQDISIPGLSVDQLQDIYKGKLTNWKQVGGPDLPIIPFARDLKASNLLNELLGQEVDQISARVQFINNYTESIRKVASTPGGISFGANALIAGQQTIRLVAISKANSQKYVQPLLDDGKRINVAAIRDSSYPLTRRRFVVFRQDGTIDQLAGEAYANMLLSKEGQQIFEKAGFVPLR
jgi:phosphate transport system substrate-binding protein